MLKKPPYVIGVVADLSGGSLTTKLKDRRFVPVQRRNSEKSPAGVRWLLEQPETPDRVRVKVLDCAKKELLRDLQRAPSFDQSALFKKLYAEELGTFGGEPFGLLLLDHSFTLHPEDLELLKMASKVGAFAQVPILFEMLREDVDLEAMKQGNWSTLRGEATASQLFGLIGRFQSGGTLFSPGYPVAALLAQCVRDPDLGATATELFRTVRIERFQFDREYSDRVGKQFAAVGVNVAPTMQSAGELVSVAGGAQLGHMLLLGMINAHLNIAARIHSGSGRFDEFAKVLLEELRVIWPDTAKGQFPLELERMDLEFNKALARLHFKAGSNLLSIAVHAPHLHYSAAGI